MTCTDWCAEAKARDALLVTAMDAAAEVMADSAASLRTIGVPIAGAVARQLETNARSLRELVTAARANPGGPIR